jgi:hypothetical protein
MSGYFRMTQTIRRPVDEVFGTAVRLDEFPRWSPRNPWAKKLTPGEIGEGTRFQMVIKGFGKVTNELREFEPNRRVMVVPLNKMFDGGHRWVFTELGDGERLPGAVARHGHAHERGAYSPWFPAPPADRRASPGAPHTAAQSNAIAGQAEQDEKQKLPHPARPVIANGP